MFPVDRERLGEPGGTSMRNVEGQGIHGWHPIPMINDREITSHPLRGDWRTGLPIFAPIAP